MKRMIMAGTAVIMRSLRKHRYRSVEKLASKLQTATDPVLFSMKATLPSLPLKGK